MFSNQEIIPGRQLLILSHGQSLILIFLALAQYSTQLFTPSSSSFLTSCLFTEFHAGCSAAGLRGSCSDLFSLLPHFLSDFFHSQDFKYHMLRTSKFFLKPQPLLTPDSNIQWPVLIACLIRIPKLTHPKPSS